MSDWLAIGPPENWRIGIQKKIWAVSPAQNKSWEKVQKGDRVFLYATAPVKGIIGYATVSQTKVDESPFWPQEKVKGHTLWPFRIHFKEVHALDPKGWESKSLKPDRKGIVFQRAFQPLAADRTAAWTKSLKRGAD